MSKIHLCDSCSQIESCDWYKYCGMNTPVFECNSYIEKCAKSNPPEWDASCCYQAGDKVLLNGEKRTIFDDGVANTPSRFMPNVKFKLFPCGIDVGERLRICRYIKTLPNCSSTLHYGYRTNAFGDIIYNGFENQEVMDKYDGNAPLEVSIYEAIPELVPNGMRYSKEFDKLVPGVVEEYIDGINLENDIGETSTKNLENKYDRKIIGKDNRECIVDVYNVLKAFDVVCPALQHLIKKALCVGIRGHKSSSEDLQDIIDSAFRAKELFKGDKDVRR